MKFSEGSIGMFVKDKKNDKIACIYGIGLNSMNEPVFKIKYAAYNFDMCAPCESNAIYIHPKNLIILKNIFENI